jgi:hypothetical protein
LTLRDLVGHAVDHAPNAVGIEDPGLLSQRVGQIRASLWGRLAPVKNAREKTLQTGKRALK